jgi:multiple sugar transport system permease protein
LSRLAGVAARLDGFLPARRRRRSTDKWRAWLLLLPTLGLLIAMSIYPLLYAGFLSLQIRNMFSPRAAHFGGLANYMELVRDSYFWRSVELTLVFSITVVSLQIVLGFVLALILSRVRKLSDLLCTLIILPVFVSPIAMGLTWRFMFEPTTGVINWILAQLGLPTSLWLSGTRMALPGIMIADTWQWTPFVAMILLAALRAIPPEIIEAARIDRLSLAQMLHRIIVPMLWPVLVVVVLIRLVDSIRIFDLVYVMTRGGPGTSTLVASVYNYTIFQSGRIGIMAAFGFLMLVFINVLVAAVLRLLARLERRDRRAMAI